MSNIQRYCSKNRMGNPKIQHIMGFLDLTTFFTLPMIPTNVSTFVDRCHFQPKWNILGPFYKTATLFAHVNFLLKNFLKRVADVLCNPRIFTPDKSPAYVLYTILETWTGGRTDKKIVFSFKKNTSGVSHPFSPRTRCCIILMTRFFLLPKTRCLIFK